ncbi:TetR/AcrR family transcriptional regulator [Pseudonocardia eucalypti]|uniref:TetR/AcrR family transcriptional regulator n=1 Tax=Pseudonocardia eucalypti TaxID=648755 RepID=A0ABP9QS54_9PSEU|nr:AcrR family transcriptional regulator [Pseudonocardia eucalypti]
MDRRAALAEGALDYVLSHGLIGLSLRPLAAALGTSDRMLIYHFGGKDELITELVSLANARLAEGMPPAEPEPETVADLVRYAWRAVNESGIAGVGRLYLELCALSMGEPERWRPAHRRLREPWLVMLRGGLGELGARPDRVATLADLVLDTIDGLLLDRMVSGDAARTDAAAEAFVDLLQGCRHGTPRSRPRAQPEAAGRPEPEP